MASLKEAMKALDVDLSIYYTPAITYIEPIIIM